MSLGKRLFIGEAAAAAATSETVDIFGDSSGIALYTLDYDASDESDNYDGTPSNVTFGVDGQINWGASFNGSSSYITASGLGLTGNPTFSVSTWINTTSSSADLFFFLGAGSTNASFYISVESGGVVRVGEFGFDLFSSTTTVNDGNWHHIAFTSDGTTSKLYIDGTESNSVANIFAISTDTLELGRGTSSYYYEGKLDQVRIFNKALSQSEVTTLYGETATVHTATTDTLNYQATNLAYYKFDSTALDETSNNHDGTAASSVAYEFGRYGATADFNGSDSFISVTHNSSFNWTNNKTLSLWVNFDTINSGNTVGIAAKGANTSNFGWYLYKLDADDRIYFQSYNASDASSQLDSGVVPIAGNWYHICVTGDASTNKIYINGVLKDSASAVTATNGTDALVFGRFYSNYVSNHLEGKIDQVRFYESTLDDTAVANLYNEKQAYITKDASNPFADDDEVAFYKFENNSNDSTGSNNGTDTSITYTSGSGIIGTYSADFNGSSSYISVPHSSTFNWTNNKTLSVWVKFDVVGSLRGIVAKGSGSSPYGWVLYMTGTSKIQFVQYNSLNQGSTLASSFTAVTNKWYHVCVTGDGTTNKLYIDGSLNHSAVAVTATNGTDALVFGRLYSDTNNYYHSGEIDQLRFFDRTLDGDEVFKLYAEVIN